MDNCSFVPIKCAPLCAIGGSCSLHRFRSPFPRKPAFCRPFQNDGDELIKRGQAQSGAMETSELLRSHLLSQQETLNAAISSLRAVTATKDEEIKGLREQRNRLDGAGSDGESEEEDEGTQDAQEDEVSRPATDSGKDPEEVLAIKGGNNIRKSFQQLQ